jgi:hypothetical protein
MTQSTRTRARAAKKTETDIAKGPTTKLMERPAKTLQNHMGHLKRDLAAAMATMHPSMARLVETTAATETMLHTTTTTPTNSPIYTEQSSSRSDAAKIRPLQAV